jgi:hypothetical protein
MKKKNRKKLKISIILKIFLEKPHQIGSKHYLVRFGNHTIMGTALIETALIGDPL